MTDATWIPVDGNSDLPPHKVPVLVVVQNNENTCRRRWVVRAKYVRQHTINCSVVDFEGDADYCEAEDEYYWPKGWYEWNDGEEMHYMIGDTVTHWAHLPGLPAVQS